MLGRFLRILDEKRIRLPRRKIEIRDIRPGDRLQIGSEVWRVSEGWPPSGTGAGSVALTAEDATAPAAVLFAPCASRGRPSPMWLLIKGSDRLEVPGETIVHFPSGARAGDLREDDGAELFNRVRQGDT